MKSHEHLHASDVCCTSADFRMRVYEYSTPSAYTLVRRMSYWCCCSLTRTPRVSSTPGAKRLTPSTAPHGSLSGVARITEMFTSTSGRGRHRLMLEAGNRPLLPATAIPPRMAQAPHWREHGSFVGLHTNAAGPEPGSSRFLRLNEM